jgi:phosphoinositide-3-kinase regulatory subunit 4
MGSQVAYLQSAPAHDLHTFLFEYPGLTPLSDQLASNKFFKTHKCLLDREGQVVTKLYVKRDPALDSDLSRFQREFESLFLYHKALPNVCMGRFFETSKAAFVVRQYFLNSLVQKYHRHPFLTEIDKRWVGFQLLEAVRQLHERGICHGDIKPENIMLTSWNWLFLT